MDILGFLAGPVLGLAGAFAPKLLTFFQDRSDKKQELAILRLQMEREAADRGGKMEALMVDAQVREFEAVQRSYASEGNDKIAPWLLGYRSMLRPNITYLFMALFIAVKVAALLTLISAGDDMKVALITVWDDQTHTLFSAILTFWFGGRQYGKG